MEMGKMVAREDPSCTVPELLRWISDFFVPAHKAICVIASVRGVYCPPDLCQSAQQDLRVWADYLEAHPSISVEFEVAKSLSSESVGEASESSPRCVSPMCAGCAPVSHFDYRRQLFDADPIRWSDQWRIEMGMDD